MQQIKIGIGFSQRNVSDIMQSSWQHWTKSNTTHWLNHCFPLNSFITSDWTSKISLTQISTLTHHPGLHSIHVRKEQEGVWLKVLIY